MDEVGSDNLHLQYDFYHMQIMEGDLVPTFRRLKDRIGHVQIADNPGRNEPGTGEINYPFIFAALDEAGYDGWVGCEYKPAAATAAGLGWFAPYAEAPPEPAALQELHGMKVGFIGLGIMGQPMALNLDKGGHELFLHTRSGVPQALLDAGGIACGSAEGGGRAGRGDHHHGPRHAAGGGGAVRRGRRRRRACRPARSWST